MADRLRTISGSTGLLIGVIVVSLLIRTAWIEQPCHSPCRSVADHLLVFDESYYVPAARVIAGLRPLPGQQYATAPSGDDPNSEHPQLVKLVIAAGIEVLGDGPLAWRLGSILAGTLAILGMFALVGAAGGGKVTATVAATLMAADNLMIVHGRIATLDAYVLAAMVWSVALYLRGRWLVAGAVLGVGACVKLVAPYALAVVAVLELLRVGALGVADRRAALRSLAGMAAATVVVGLGLLQALDLVAPPYDPQTGRLVGGGALGHLAHMLSYAAAQVSPHGPRGIASYPWSWLLDLKPIVYLNINPAEPTPGLTGDHPAVHFLGMISPPILLAGLPALAWIGWSLVRGRARPGGEAPRLALAWFIGTFLPFAALSLLLQRTSYLYYMVVVMPGVYAAAALVVVPLARRHRRSVAVWAFLVVAAAAIMYPFTPLP